MAIERHLPPNVARASLICVNTMRGDGSPSNPERLINLYFRDDGELMACYDPLNGLPDSFDTLLKKGACGEAAGSWRASMWGTDVVQ